MDRKTEYDFAKTIMMLEKMGLKEAAERLEQEMTESEEEQVNEEEIEEGAEDKELDEEVENLQEKVCPKCKSKPCVCPNKNESISLKGMTKAELTETIKEMIKQKLNKRSE
jgi:hypothetical protein